MCPLDAEKDIEDSYEERLAYEMALGKAIESLKMELKKIFPDEEQRQKEIFKLMSYWSTDVENKQMYPVTKIGDLKSYLSLYFTPTHKEGTLIVKIEFPKLRGRDFGRKMILKELIQPNPTLKGIYPLKADVKYPKLHTKEFQQNPITFGQEQNALAVKRALAANEKGKKR